MTKLLIGDEDFDHTAVNYLREWGYDVITVHQLGLANIRYPDPLVLRRAIELSRIVLTHNRKDFRRLHRQVEHHYGIVMCRQMPDHKRLAEKIADLIESTESFEGKLFSVHRD